MKPIHRSLSLFGIPLLGGMLYASAFPMANEFQFLLGTILGMMVFLWALHQQFDQGFKSSLYVIFSFNLGFNLLGFYWIPYTLSEFGELPFPVNYLLWLLFSFIIAPQYYFYLLLRCPKNRFGAFVEQLSQAQQNLSWALILTLLEYFVPQQFPAHIGHPWLALAPYLGLAPIFGAPLFSLISFWLSLSFIHWLNTKKFDRWALTVSLLFIGANIAMPLTKQNDGPAKTLNVRMVQGNIGNFIKLNSEQGEKSAYDLVLDRYLKQSLAPLSASIEGGLDLIIWPETAYPQLLSSKLMQSNSSYIPPVFKHITDQTGAYLLTGGYDQAASFNQHYFETEFNTAFLFAPQHELKNFYHKIKLIPFGEGLPFGPLNPYLGKLITNISYFAAGTDYPLLKVKDDIGFVTAICYEILFSHFMRNYLNSVSTVPHFIVNLTNDSWYGKTSEPFQHLFLAKWRSVEFSIPILRMTNTGITTIVFPDGSESQRLPWYEVTFLDWQLKLGTPEKTLFQTWGIWGTLILALSLLALMKLSRSIRKE